VSDIDVSDIVDCMSFHSVTVARPDEEGEFDYDGLYGFATTSTLTIQGSVQHATPEARAVLPEGIRRMAEFMIYTTQPIYGELDSPNTNADIVQGWKGSNWKVMATTRWEHMGYYVGLLVRLTRRESDA
jgi:hypothetical protein